MRYFFIFILFNFMLFSCSQDIITPERVINTPTSVKVSSYKNSIKVSFFGNNSEEGFQGYNIYVSSSPNIENQKLSPVKNIYNAYPTFPYYFSGCYSDGSAESSIILSKDSFNTGISNHKTYYISVKAIASIGDTEYESEFSQEASVYVLKYTNFILYNNNINSQTNDGFIFDTFKITDAPDGAVGSSDALFKLVSISDKILPAIILNNNIFMEDKGFYDTIYEDVNNINVSNIENKTNIILPNHLYLVKKGDIIYRLYIEKLVDSASSLTENINVELSFGY